MKLKISPSVMVCKTQEVLDFIKAFEKAGVDSIHFDVMDGHFVDNIMLGTNFYRDLKELTDIPIDIHFMTYNPEKFLTYFNPKPNDRVSFHPEATKQSYRLLQSIQDLGCSAGIVLNPGTSISYIEELYFQLDFVTLMMVNPGFSGQKLVPNGLEKISRTRNLLNKLKKNIDIFVDGNTTYQNAREMYLSGANGVIIGTSSIVKSLNSFISEYQKYCSFIIGD